MIWTRCQRESKVTWTVATDQALRHVVASGQVPARSEHDLTVKVDVDNLEPGTTYYYFFEAERETSAVGRTRTLPAECDHFRFAVYSCAKYNAGYFNAHARMAERDDIGFVLCLGDYIYEYGNHQKGLGAKIGRAFEPDNECRNLEDYRNRYSQYRRDPMLQRLHQMHPLINIVDDHEFCNDTWRDGAGGQHDKEDGDWHVRKEAAFRAWREWIPVRLPDPHDPTRIYRTVSLGALADLILLDSRTRRDKQTKDRQVLEQADRTILGKEQLDWFQRECKRSKAAWCIVANAVMMGQVKSHFMPEELGNPLSELGVLTAREHGPEPDQWDGYPAERRRLLECIQDNGLSNVLFLSGDCHSSWAIDIRLDPDHPEQRSIGAEFCATSVTSENLDDDAGWDSRTRSIEIEKEIVTRNPHIHWVETDSHGYLIVDVGSDRIQGDWWFVDAIHVPHPGQHSSESWMVQRDERHIRKAPGPVLNGPAAAAFSTALRASQASAPGDPSAPST
jgi:alkaline phosphatase D